jgi:hypothetical protein
MSLSDPNDKPDRTRKPRKNYVQMHRDAPAEVEAWLMAHTLDVTTGKQGPVEGPLSTFLRLFAAVEWRPWKPHEIRGSDSRVGALLGVKRKTLERRMEVVVRAGLVEDLGSASNKDTLDEGGYAIPDDVYEWMQTGGVIPPLKAALDGAVGDPHLVTGDPHLVTGDPAYHV